MRIQSRTKLLDLLHYSSYAGLSVLSSTTLVESNPRLLSPSSHGRALPLEQPPSFFCLYFSKARFQLPPSRGAGQSFDFAQLHGVCGLCEQMLNNTTVPRPPSCVRVARGVEQ